MGVGIPIYEQSLQLRPKLPHGEMFHGLTHQTGQEYLETCILFGYQSNSNLERFQLNLECHDWYATI